MNLTAQGLVKSYGRRTVVRGVEVHVEPGEVVGLLGPNGAGKTTCFQIIMGLVRPDAGTSPAVVGSRGTFMAVSAAAPGECPGGAPPGLPCMGAGIPLAPPGPRNPG